jgi:hypothetical protein
MANAGPQQRPSRAVRIAAYTLGFVVVAAIIGGLLGFRHYVTTSPGFCQTCHDVAPEMATWIQGKHHDLYCQQCHHQDLRQSFGILTTYLTGGASPRPHSRVTVESCTGCHAQKDTRWKNISASIGHRIHHDRAQLPCVQCHGREMHFGQPARETCSQCHAGKFSGGPHESAHCLACHNFLSTDEVIVPTRADCLRCHEGLGRPLRISAEAPMKFACGTCHRPHRDTKAVPCSDCHEPRDLTGLHSRTGHDDCGSCHKPHDWKATPANCAECHRMPKTHYPGRTCTSCHGFKKGMQTGR